jgi:hypothetical protein
MEGALLMRVAMLSPRPGDGGPRRHDLRRRGQQEGAWVAPSAAAFAPSSLCRDNETRVCCARVVAAAQPIGGHVLAHASTTRLYLKKGASRTRRRCCWSRKKGPPACRRAPVLSHRVAGGADPALRASASAPRRQSGEPPVQGGLLAAHAGG